MEKLSEENHIISIKIGYRKTKTTISYLYVFDSQYLASSRYIDKLFKLSDIRYENLKRIESVLVSFYQHSLEHSFNVH